MPPPAPPAPHTFTTSRLHGRDITRLEPGVAHVARAQAWIRLHHERPVSLAGIARAVSLNPAYLSRCFRRITGQTVGQALLAMRVLTYSLP
jgi:transcriptional regulator GlxA family with amidase domain